MRSITEKSLQLIKQHEGFSPTAYICAGGYKSIGYGHVIENERDKFKDGIDHDTALELLSKDVQIAERVVLAMIRVALTDNQISALTALVFNIGSGAFQRSRLRQYVNRSEHDSVPSEFMKWCWAGGRRLRGLELRRAAEARLYQQ